jgi:hypothetical protein
MQTLLSAFSLQAEGTGSTLRVYPGMSGPEAKFWLQFDATYAAGPPGQTVDKSSTFAYDCASGTLAKDPLTPGDPVTLDPNHPVMLGLDGERKFFEITYRPVLTFTDPSNQDHFLQKCTSKVRFMLDSSAFIPPEAPLEYVMCSAPGKLGSEVSSKDIG